LLDRALDGAWIARCANHEHEEGPLSGLRRRNVNHRILSSSPVAEANVVDDTDDVDRLAAIQFVEANLGADRRPRGAGPRPNARTHIAEIAAVKARMAGFA
jgi:hypothetical protein